ncbi:MAG: ACT domain-containing protein [Candidatus Limnocylindrales bacterium]
MIWFTVQLDDKPGALARMAGALSERGINITAIVGIAEDTDGALMLTTSDAAATRKAFESLKLAFEEHDPEAGMTLDDMSRATGLSDHGISVGG